MLKINKKIMKTQKERIDKGRQAFNDEIIRCSESDNIYEAISEWEFTWGIDYYSRDIDIDIMKEILVNEGRSDIVDKVKINEYGEKAYYSMVYTLCSVGADLKWQLDDIGVDYTQIDDFELFYSLLSRSYSKEQTRILFGDVLDFSEMQLMYNNNLQENVLVQFFDDETYIQIDRYVYNAIVSTLRKIHRIKRNDEIPGNEATRQILIEDARDEYEENKNKPAKPYLLPLVSAMVNSTGFKRDDKSVFGMNIYAFMDSVARISKIKNSELLLQSGYSGFGIDLKKVNSDETNWLGELN